MKPCRNCGLSIGDTAAFCPVCCAVVDVTESSTATVTAADPAPAAAASTAAPQPTVKAAPPSPADLRAEAQHCERTDPARAAALYRRAIVERLEADDALESKAGRRDVRSLFDRLSLVLERDGRLDEALEEIEAAAYLGLLDDGDAGAQAQRDTLVGRREAILRASVTS